MEDAGQTPGHLPVEGGTAQEYCRSNRDSAGASTASRACRLPKRLQVPSALRLRLPLPCQEEGKVPALWYAPRAGVPGGFPVRNPQGAIRSPWLDAAGSPLKGPLSRREVGVDGFSLLRKST